MTLDDRIAPWERAFWPLVATTGVLGIWYAGVWLTATKVFPTPLDVVRGFIELMRKGLLLGYTADSLYRVLTGYLLGLVLGVPAGMALGWHQLAAKTVNPVIQILRPISPLAWIPLAIVWFGVSDAAPIFLIFLASFFNIVVASANGVRNVPPMYIQSAQNFGLSSVAVITRVVFPAALPKVLVGLRIALGVAWLVVVAAEMIAVDSGLGYLIMDSRNAGKRYDMVVAGMILIGVIGLLLDLAARRLERLKAVRWGFRNEQ